MELLQITKEIYEVSRRLSKVPETLHKLAKEKSDSERAYRIRLAQEMLILRAEGMPASLISDVSRGNIGDLLFARDASEAKFRAAIESLSALQSQLSALQSILKVQQEI